MSNLTVAALWALLIGMAPHPWEGAAQVPEPIAIVVHESNPVRDLSMEELRRIYLGSITMFEHGERVVLLEASEHRTSFYRSALDMGEDRLNRHWISRVFAGRAGSPPQEMRSDGELRSYVAAHAGAIAFLSAASVDDTVKVVTITGLGPDDAGYPLR